MSLTGNANLDSPQADGSGTLANDIFTAGVGGGVLNNPVVAGGVFTGPTISGGTLSGVTISAVGLILSSLPTTLSGLPAGALWNNGGVLCVA